SPRSVHPPPPGRLLIVCPGALDEPGHGAITRSSVGETRFATRWATEPPTSGTEGGTRESGWRTYHTRKRATAHRTRLRSANTDYACCRRAPPRHGRPTRTRRRHDRPGA